MATPTNQAEDIARDMFAKFSMFLATYVTEVVTRRNAQFTTTDVLAAPVAIDFGFDPALLTYPKQATLYPRVSIVAAPRADLINVASDRFAQVEHTVIVEWLTFGVTTQLATVANWRFGEAVLGVLQDKQPFGGFTIDTLVPPVDEGIPLLINGDLNSAGPAGYVAGSSVQLPMKGRYVR